MALFRSFSEIVNSMIQRLRLVQPNLDTKPGTVSRDLFIDIQADQLDKLYKAISIISSKQSLASATGRDLDNLARNFTVIRRGGTPSSGLAVFTTSSLITDIPIPNGTIVSARNGASFKVIGSHLMSASEKNSYVATANKMKGSLNLYGINDSYAIEVPVQATRAGDSGNIGTGQVISSNIASSSSEMNITNIASFNGGTNTESDGAFKARILSVFSGSNVGTSAGYKNAALSVTGAVDALVVEPGNTLMLRDGTETIEINNGSMRIISSGTGGKVDVYVLGRLLQEMSESYIYTDLSGTGDSADERNEYVLGQRELDDTLTSDEKRLYSLANNIIPFQPVSAIASLSGTKSGVFAEKSTDEDGNVAGNYELIYDLNAETGGSPFGMDKIRWISSSKDVSGEIKIKQDLNSIEPLSFSDITLIKSVYRDVPISEENSSVSSGDRSIIKLIHYPVKSVSRVKNETTGEVYSIKSQNISSDTGLNDIGEVSISGKTLPTSSDILSVDYTWRHFYDGFINYNGNSGQSSFSDESISEAIDWGVSGGIQEETSVLERSDDGVEYNFSTKHDISRVVSVYKKMALDIEVTQEYVGDIIFYAAVVPSTHDEVLNVISIKNSTGVEVYNTKKSNGSFSSRVIYFPADSIVSLGETVSVSFNKVELFNVDGGDGSYFNNITTLPSSDILTGLELLSTVDSMFELEEDIYIKYVSKILEISPIKQMTSLPITGSGTSNLLMDSGLSTISGSIQPVSYNFNEYSAPSSIERFAPTRILASVFDTKTHGKLKVSGTGLYRMDMVLVAGTSMDGLLFDIQSELEGMFDTSGCTDDIGIARVDLVAKLDSDGNIEDEYDVLGTSIANNAYDFTSSVVDSSLKSCHFMLPSTDSNNSISVSSGTDVLIKILVYKNNDFEDLYFKGDQIRITNKMFVRIDRVSVTSGFRSSSGILIGSVSLVPFNQPASGDRYSVMTWIL